MLQRQEKETFFRRTLHDENGPIKTSRADMPVKLSIVIRHALTRLELIFQYVTVINALKNRPIPHPAFRVIGIKYVCLG